MVVMAFSLPEAVAQCTPADILEKTRNDLYRFLCSGHSSGAIGLNFRQVVIGAGFETRPYRASASAASPGSGPSARAHNSSWNRLGPRMSLRVKSDLLAKSRTRNGLRS